MTVAPLPTTPLPAWLTNAQAAMNTPFDANSVSPGQARAVVAEIGRLEARLAARKLAYIRALDQAEVANSAGATSTSTLISGDFGGDRAGAARQVHTARNLAQATLAERRCPTVRCRPTKPPSWRVR